MSSLTLGHRGFTYILFRNNKEILHFRSIENVFVVNKMEKHSTVLYMICVFYSYQYYIRDVCRIFLSTQDGSMKYNNIISYFP